jgi:transcriptional regulator with XRE-family HTH domain
MAQLNHVALRELRMKTGLTISGLAELVPMPQPNLSRIEAGDEQPSWDRLVAIAAALKVLPQSLVGPDDLDQVTGETWPFQRGRKRRVAVA